MVTISVKIGETSDNKYNSETENKVKLNFVYFV